jgi:hypothetical protein
MKKTILSALALSVLATPVALPAPAFARHNDNNWRGGNHGWDPSGSYRPGKYRDRRLGRNDQVYRGHDGRYYCRRSDGTTGLVIGALGGGLAGNLLGGGTLGTLLGAGGGALLGRSIDRGNVKCR